VLLGSTVAALVGIGWGLIYIRQLGTRSGAGPSVSDAPSVTS
jgi:hypothetical protein